MRSPAADEQDVETLMLLAAVLFWVLAALLVGVVVGRGIRVADQRSAGPRGC